MIFNIFTNNDVEDEKWQKDALNEYIKRISKYAKIKFLPITKLKSIKEKDSMIHFIFSDNGEEIDSIELSKFISEAMLKASQINIVIDNSLSLEHFSMEDYKSMENKETIETIECKEAMECKKILLFTVRISESTLKILLLEQLYRSFKIINNETYHK